MTKILTSFQGFRTISKLSAAIPTRSPQLDKALVPAVLPCTSHPSRAKLACLFRRLCKWIASHEEDVQLISSSMMSGASGLNFNIKSDLVANNTRTVAETLGCIKGEFDSALTVDCLRDTPLEKLMNVSVSLARKLRPPFGELSFYPSFDDYYIAERPSVLLKKGQFVKSRSTTSHFQGVDTSLSSFNLDLILDVCLYTIPSSLTSYTTRLPNTRQSYIWHPVSKTPTSQADTQHTLHYNTNRPA